MQHILLTLIHWIAIHLLYSSICPTTGPWFTLWNHNRRVANPICSRRLLFNSHLNSVFLTLKGNNEKKCLQPWSTMQNLDYKLDLQIQGLASIIPSYLWQVEQKESDNSLSWCTWQKFLLNISLHIGILINLHETHQSKCEDLTLLILWDVIAWNILTLWYSVTISRMM